MSGAFERVMVHNSIRRSEKLRRLAVPERWAFMIALSIAGDAPVRGRLMIADGVPVTAADIGHAADVDEPVVHSMIARLLEYGTLVRGDDGVLEFANWSSFNPEPKASDSREAWRERKRLERARKRADTPASEATPAPQFMLGTPMRLTLAWPARPRSTRQRDAMHYDDLVAAWCAEHAPGLDAGLVRHAAYECEKRGLPVTRENMRPVLDRWAPQAATA